jgi:hypothetical protein
VKRSRSVLFGLVMSLPLVLIAVGADAQRGKGHHHPTKAPTHHDAGAAARPTGTHRIEVGRDAGAAEPVRANPDAGVVEAKTLDGGTRVFRFGEMEVEGRLRSPQIVYFLRRVRAEFAAGDLGHRSFLGELSETRKTNAF